FHSNSGALPGHLRATSLCFVIAAVLARRDCWRTQSRAYRAAASPSSGDRSERNAIAACLLIPEQLKSWVRRLATEADLGFARWCPFPQFPLDRVQQWNSRSGP